MSAGHFSPTHRNWRCLQDIHQSIPTNFTASPSYTLIQNTGMEDANKTSTTRQWQSAEKDLHSTSISLAACPGSAQLSLPSICHLSTLCRRPTLCTVLYHPSFCEVPLTMYQQCYGTFFLQGWCSTCQACWLLAFWLHALLTTWPVPPNHVRTVPTHAGWWQSPALGGNCHHALT
jgi:hypothetical protein